MSTALVLSCWSLLIALTAAGVVELVRQIPWVDRAMMAGKKPWVCNLCMSFWTTLLSTGFWTWIEDARWLSAVPAFALAMLVVNQLGAPLSTPNFSIDDLPEVPE